MKLYVCNLIKYFIRFQNIFNINNMALLLTSNEIITILQ